MWTTEIIICLEADHAWTMEIVQEKRQYIKKNNNYFLTWISAQVKEMGGFVFRNCEIHFSRVFWVRNK